MNKEHILFDSFPLTFLSDEVDCSNFEDEQERTYRERIAQMTEELKSLRMEITEKHSIRSMLEEKVAMLQNEEQTKQNNLKYVLNFCDKQMYERELGNFHNHLEQLRKQIQNSNCKIKLLIEKEFKVRKQLQLRYMKLYDLLNERVRYILGDYVKHRKCACAIFAYRQEGQR
ncbi:conserved Plasmodium protein, unknown function [Plasmodium vivax]|uniref:Uncharacterized protein n=6 Tax=Plasmodium vivax TaxID=5855 RepID=A5KB66_PLAVS|nr:hypothetical protein, conserved [Plasmodium vivax]KMZ80742.1 hypothetical protein PVIIG_03109 [Plasmodium vivax India VII]KMZ86819.1 hypothetical protein PVBG_04477 [Plasmodium vivax Brazil I]KMZ93646.1 hypothetical protein PVMG_01092 [Plasmodium vivax Mauritania I]KMZ99813.1 hypothetical protein PVNG_04090 [Plasmodium vivax North Korean]AAF99479.1 PV1H14165_P [Plasmodium vivax]|eukprot:XP_001613071.1 hypothetical protein [Plasmodium vivax Sal-1]